MQSQWIIAPPEELEDGPIAWSEVCGSPCISRLLARRGFVCREEVENFLHPRLKSLGDKLRGFPRILHFRILPLEFGSLQRDVVLLVVGTGLGVGVLGSWLSVRSYLTR